MCGLYIHIPFCLSKCPYCDFYSVKFDEKTAEDYASAVIRNIKRYNERYDTVYFGGGTPVLLYKEIARILESTDIANGAEITVEANPFSSAEAALSELKSAGINRISFGVQSLSDIELKALGRRHSADEARKTITLAESLGFDNISADIMLATPRQTKESLSETVSGLSALPLSHISAYLLKIEEGTFFAKKTPVLPSEDETDELYLAACDLLEENGFKQYEISNFAKIDKESRHNLKYWNSEDYIGIGAAAHSCYNDKRYCVPRDIDGFIRSEFQTEIEDDEKPHSFEEYAMLRLRLTAGLSFSDCEKYGVSRSEMLRRAALVPKDYLRIDDKKIAITPKGFLVSNQIIGRLVL